MQYQKPKVAASVAVFARENNSLLLIRRSTNPYKNMYAFPGGFLDVGQEDLYQTAVRELAEETGIKIKSDDLILIDVRSNPKRDPRDHVIDVGFLCIINQIQPIPRITEEARPEWLPWDQLNQLKFAFDHDRYWENIKSYMLKTKTSMTK